MKDKSENYHEYPRKFYELFFLITKTKSTTFQAFKILFTIEEEWNRSFSLGGGLSTLPLTTHYIPCVRRTENLEAQPQDHRAQRGPSRVQVSKGPLARGE